MKYLSSYIKDPSVYYSDMFVENARDLFINYGGAIDSALYKFKRYYNGQIHGYINESNDDVTLTYDESVAVTNIFRFVIEDQIKNLEKESTVYEGLLNGTIPVNEALKLTQSLKNLYSAGKEKVKQAWTDIKVKIKDLKVLLGKLATQAIKSLKQMAEYLIQILAKLNCTISYLFTSSGFKEDEAEKAWMEAGQDVVNNVDKLKNDDHNVYESYGKWLETITEDKTIHPVNLKRTTVDQTTEPNKFDKTTGEHNIQSGKGDTKRSVMGMIWRTFRQLAVWAVVCIVIPGTVVAVFPGTFIALIVPIVCKIGWNGYKITKIYFQVKSLIGPKGKWKTYTKVQKCITIFGWIISLAAIGANFRSSFIDIGKVWSGLSKTGFDVLAKANLGIQPDILARGWASVITWIKNGITGQGGTLSEIYQNISDSFAEHMHFVTEKVIKTTAKMGQSGEELLSKYQGGKFDTSTHVWTKWIDKVKMDPSQIQDNGMYDIAVDGSSAGAPFKALQKAAKALGFDLQPSDALNKGLNVMNPNAGSITGLHNVPGSLLKKLLAAHQQIGVNGHFGILGGTVETLSKITSVTDIVNAATSMAITWPPIIYKFQNSGGFRVRLGEPGDKSKYIYEVPEDGIKADKLDDDDRKQLKDFMDASAEYFKKISDSTDNNKEMSDEQKETVRKNLEEFKENFQKQIKDMQKITFYGKRVKEEDKKNEDFDSDTIYTLYDYLTETKDSAAYTVQVKKGIDIEKIKAAAKAAKVDPEGKRIKQYPSQKTDIVGIWTGKDKKTAIRFANALDKEGITAQVSQNGTVVYTPENSNSQNTDSQQTDNQNIKNQEDTKNKETDNSQQTDNQEDTKNQENTDSQQTANQEDTKNQDDIKNQDDDKKKEEWHDESVDGLKPVLEFLPSLVGHDIADSDKNGPRKDPYSMKGMFFELEFIAIEGGTAPKDLQKVLGDILYNMTFNCWNALADKPCLNKKENLKGDWYVNEKSSMYKPDDERPELGQFTNKEITDIMNNGDKAYKYLGQQSKSFEYVKTQEDKKNKEKYKQKDKDLIDNNKDIQEEIKKVNDKIYKDDGTVDHKEMDKFIDSLSDYQLTQHKSNGKKPGLFRKILNFFFGGYKQNDLARINDLIVSKSQNESLSFDLPQSEYRSLRDYLIAD